MKLEKSKFILTSRFGALIVMLVATPFLPWWGIVVVALLTASLFPHFYELALAGLWFDLLYHAPGAPGRSPFYLALGLLFLVFLVEEIKRTIYFQTTNA